MGEGKPPSLPYWFTYIAFTIAILWMLICGYMIIIMGLAFEANSCTFSKYEKELCDGQAKGKPLAPGKVVVPSECNYPTKQGCMDVTYDWLIGSTMALIQVRRPPLPWCCAALRSGPDVTRAIADRRARPRLRRTFA